MSRCCLLNFEPLFADDSNFIKGTNFLLFQKKPFRKEPRKAHGSYMIFLSSPTSIQAEGFVSSPTKPISILQKIGVNFRLPLPLKPFWKLSKLIQRLYPSESESITIAKVWFKKFACTLLSYLQPSAIFQIFQTFNLCHVGHLFYHLDLNLEPCEPE